MTRLYPGNRRFFLFTACAHAARAVTFCCSTKSNQKGNQRGRPQPLARKWPRPFGIPITPPHFLRRKAPPLSHGCAVPALPKGEPRACGAVFCIDYHSCEIQQLICSIPTNSGEAACFPLRGKWIDAKHQDERGACGVAQPKVVSFPFLRGSCRTQCG
jgi:hypothetical protein